MQAHLYNGQSLAYIGDACYEIQIRLYLLKKGLTKVNSLHKEAIKYTSGIAQSKAINFLLENKILTLEEEMIYHRGRNIKCGQNRKNISIADYQKATGFEAIIGYLYLINNTNRIKEIVDLVINYLEGDTSDGQ